MLKTGFFVVAWLFSCLLAATPITLTTYKQFTQMSSGYQFHTFNLGFMNGCFYSLYGFGFNKACVASATSYTLQALTNLVSSTSISMMTTMVALPDANKLLYVNSYSGVVYLIDPANLASPIVASQALEYFGTLVVDYLVYQMERKPNTNYFFLTSYYTKTIQKIDFTNLGNPTRIISGPVNNEGYERLSASPDTNLVVLSVNGLRADVYDMNSNAFIKSLNLPVAWQGVAYRGVKHYPRVPQSDFFFITSTAKIGFLVNAAQSTTDKQFSLPNVWDGCTLTYLEGTRWMAVMSLTYLYFVNMEGTDSDTKVHSLAYSVTYGVMFSVQYNSNYYLAATYYNGTGITYMLDLSTHFCHFSCATCTKSMDPNACSSCQAGYTSSGSQCQPIAPPGQVVQGGSPASNCNANQYKNFDNVCTSCPPSGCSTCASFTGYCTACTTPTDNINPQGQCVPSCTSHQFSTTVSSVNYCKECHTSCLTCSGSGISQCNTCDGTKSFVQNGNTCTDRCVGAASSITSYVSLNDTCNECTGLGSCKQCTYPGLGFSCTLCTSGYYSFDGLCLGSCPTGLYANTAAMTCETCEEKGLDKIYFNGSCITNTQCPSGYTYQKLKCVNGSTQTNTSDPFGAPTNTSLNTSTKTNTTVNSTSNGDSKESSGSGIGSYIFYIILGLLVVAIVAGGIMCYIRHKRQKKLQQQISPMQNPNMRTPVGPVDPRLQYPAYPPYPYPPGPYGQSHYGQHQNQPEQDGEDEDDGDWDLGESQGAGQYQNYSMRRPGGDVPPMEVVNMANKQPGLFVQGQKKPPVKFVPNSASDWNLGEGSGTTGGRLMESNMSEMNRLSARPGLDANSPEGKQPLEAGFSQLPPRDNSSSPLPRKTLQRKNF